MWWKLLIHSSRWPGTVAVQCHPGFLLFNKDVLRNILSPLRMLCFHFQDYLKVLIFMLSDLCQCIYNFDVCVRLFVTPVDYSLPGSSVHGILQARILEWVAIPFSRVCSRSRDRTQVSCIAGRFFTSKLTGKLYNCDTALHRLCFAFIFSRPLLVFSSQVSMCHIWMATHGLSNLITLNKFSVAFKLVS